MGKLPTIAVCYIAAVDDSQLAERRGPTRMTDALPEYNIVDMRDRTPEDLSPSELEQLQDVEVAFILYMPDWLLAACPNLKWIHSFMTGHDHIPLPQLKERNIRLTNGAGTAAIEIAEFVIARVLEHWKSFPEIAALQVEHKWRPVFGRALSEAHIVLVGYGPINQQVARLLAPFDMRVTAVRRSATTPSPGANRVVAFADLNAAMHDADIVVAAVPSNDDTTGMFNKEKFAAMQQGCLFINVGRGTAVVEADLIASLETGHLGGAAVDVASEEPLPPDNALWNSPVRISAHCSATLPNTMRRVHELFFRNIAKFATGERFENEVDL